ncbi:MAG: peptidylprolyl isomerase [Gemmatimonadetes bacterium]|nr:peptidylprolyl isomerase [Gemmatimonadota bacterium]
MDPTGEQATQTAPDEFKVRFETSAGAFVIDVTRDWSPRGADRFYSLIRIGFYDDQRFFRVLPNFVVQWGMSGDPEVTAAWQTARIKDDPVKESNVPGTITFAKTNAPNSRTTQLFINLGDNSANLDGQGFAPFGRVVEGMEVVGSFNAEYGSTPSTNQATIAERGNEFLNKNFPNLDYIVTAKIVE